MGAPKKQQVKTDYSIRRRIYDFANDRWKEWESPAHGQWQGAQILHSQIRILKSGNRKIELEIKRNGNLCDGNGMPSEKTIILE